MSRRYEVSLGKQGLRFHIPEPDGYPEGSLYSVEVPFTEQGMRFIRRTLEADARDPEGKIVVSGRSPTQIQVEEWLKADRLAMKAITAPVVLDIDIDSLDLDF